MDANSIRISLTNETEGYVFSEVRESLDDYYETPGDVYRALQREYGVCRSKVYVDTSDGPKHVGWYFESRQQYEDTGEHYLRGAWCTLETIEPPRYAAID